MTQNCAFSSQRQTGSGVRRRMASLQTSRQSASHSHSPLPIDVRASGLSTEAICVAACPALQNSTINSASLSRSVSQRAARPGQKAKATVLASAAPSSSGVNDQICQSARGSPDTRRFGATFTKGNATAAMATQANSSRTRL